MSHRYTNRFRYTLTDLKDCRDVIKAIMSKSGKADHNTVLEKDELKAAHELIALCGEIVGIVVAEGNWPEDDAICVVCDGETDGLKDIFDDAAQHFIDLSDQENRLLDEAYEREQIAKSQQEGGSDEMV